MSRSTCDRLSVASGGTPKGHQFCNFDDMMVGGTPKVTNSLINFFLKNIYIIRDESSISSDNSQSCALCVKYYCEPMKQYNDARQWTGSWHFWKTAM